VGAAALQSRTTEELRQRPLRRRQTAYRDASDLRLERQEKKTAFENQFFDQS
jgi:hypothetical protein